MSQYYYNPFGGNDVTEAMKMQMMREKRVKEEKHEIRTISFFMGCAIIAFLVIQSFFVLIISLFDNIDLFLNDSVFQYAFNVIAGSVCSVALPFGIVALINKRKYKSPVVPAKNIKPSRCFAWVGFGMLCCIAANYIVSLLMLVCEYVFKRKLTQSEMVEPDSVFSCVMFVVAIAIIPAICEEFAMRCCSLQLLKNYGKGFAVFAVSIVFGILHGNVIQFVFAFIIGLVLGFVTIKTESIVPAILIHAFNNGMSAVQSIVKYAAGQDASDYTVVGIYIFWVVFGIASALYLLIKGEFRTKIKEKSNSILTTGQKFTAFLFPWMIVPFALLLWLTSQYIEKV